MKRLSIFFSFVFIHSLSGIPTGMQVVSGQAEMQASAAGAMQIFASDRSILHWEDFSIGRGEKLQFVLPDAASAALNRVTGLQMSELLGSLEANGQVYLINPNGVIVGREARIDSGQFIASTFDVLDEDFLAKADLIFKGDSSSSIVNLGTIATQYGDCVLLARNVTNEGIIQAPNGAAVLAGGAEILLKPDGSRRVFIQAAVSADEGAISINNSGQIQALCVELQADGNPYSAAIRHNGRIEALGVKREHGRVLLVAEGGKLDVAGEIRATASEMIPEFSATEAFGEIRAVAEEIQVRDQAMLDVSNPQGGGLITLGFEIEEDGCRAKRLWTKEETLLKADAMGKGNGGQVLMWGTDFHYFGAYVSAQGGQEGGDGGFVDASTLGMFQAQGLADTSAPCGRTGVLLYDPTDILISKEGGSIDTSMLQANLAISNVTIETASSSAENGDIIIADPVSWRSAHSLTLNAERDIFFNASVQSPGVGGLFSSSARDTFVAEGVTLSTIELETGRDLVLHSSFIENASLDIGRDLVLSDSKISTSLGTWDIGRNVIQHDATMRAYSSRLHIGGQHFLERSHIEISGNVEHTVGTGMTCEGGSRIEFAHKTSATYELSILDGNLQMASGANIHVNGLGANHLTIRVPNGSFQIEEDISYGPQASGHLTIEIGGDLRMKDINARDLVLTTGGNLIQMGVIETGICQLNIHGDYLLEGRTRSEHQDIIVGENLILKENTAIESSKGLSVRTGDLLITEGTLKTNQGILEVNVSGNILMQGGSIGSGVKNEIYVDAGQNIVLNGTIGNQDGSGMIQVNAGGDIVLQAGVDSSALIGHRNVTAGANPGNLTVTAEGSILLNGGPFPSAYAQIGHGGIAYSPVTLLVEAGRNIVLQAGAGPAQIVNFGESESSITLIADNCYEAPNCGPGYFSLSQGSFLLTGSENTPVKIYSGVRLFNLAGEINGSMFTPGPLGLDNPFEKWGVYAPDGAYSSGQPFQFYYKQIGGLLISDAPDSGCFFKEGKYTFTSAEPNLNSALLSGRLASHSVEIKSTHSLLVREALDWAAPTSLTLKSSQDLIVDASISSSGNIVLFADRNAWIGDAAQKTSAFISSQSFTGSAGGRFDLLGGALSGASAGIAVKGALKVSSNRSAFFGGAGDNAHIFVSADENAVFHVSGDLDFGGGAGVNSYAKAELGNGSFAAGHVAITGGNGRGTVAGIDGKGPIDLQILGNLSLRKSAFIRTEGDLLIKSDDMTLQGGPNPHDHVVVHSEADLRVIAEGNVSLQAGSGGESFAQIGARRILSLSSEGNLSLTAQNNGWAAITDGETIDVSSQSGILLRGEIGGQSTDRSGFARIGHANARTLTVSANDAIVQQGGSFDNGSACLTGKEMVVTARALSVFAGKGSKGASASILGSNPVSVTVTGGDLFLQSGGGPQSNAQIFTENGPCNISAQGNVILNLGLGTGVEASIVPASGKASLSIDGSLTLVGGLSDRAAAFIGGAGDLEISVQSDCIMTSGAGAQSFAALGSKGSHDVTISAGGHLLMETQGEGWTQIGPAGTGNLTVAANGNIILTAAPESYGDCGFAQIGHGNAKALSGNIHVTAGQKIDLIPGCKATGFARIGHGSADLFGTGEVTVIAGSTIALRNSKDGKLAQIVNPCMGNITLVADHRHPGLESGTGHFSFSDGLLSASSGRVKIYTSARIFDLLEENLSINGTTYIPQPLGISGGNEEWGFAYVTDSENPCHEGFTIYYKRIGGIHLSSAPTSGAILEDANYTFTSPEVNLNTNELLTTLSVGNVEIDASRLNGTTDAMNSIQLSGTLSWPDENGLTLIAPGDISLGSILKNTSAASFSYGLTLLPSRDAFIEEEVSVIEAPVTISAGRDLVIQKAISSTGTGDLGNSIHLTASRHLMLQSAVITADAKVAATAHTGDMTIQGGYGSPSGIFTKNTVSGQGSITVSVPYGDLVLKGGSGGRSAAELHAKNSPITVITGGDLKIAGGYPNSLFSHGSASAGISNSEDIKITVEKALTLTGSTSISGYDGQAWIFSSATGPSTVTVSTGSDLTIQAGVSANNGAAGVFCNTHGTIEITSGGNLVLNASNMPLSQFLTIENRDNAPASIGSFATGSMGLIDIKIGPVERDLILIGNRNNYAAIGNGNSGSASNVSGEITIHGVAGRIFLNAYGKNNPTGGAGFAQIGDLNTPLSSASSLMGGISITATGDIELHGGVEPSAFARIGHGGQLKTNGFDFFYGNVSVCTTHGSICLDSKVSPGNYTSVIRAYGNCPVKIDANQFTYLQGGVLIQGDNGPIELIAGKSQVHTGAYLIQNDHKEGITIVADHLFPDPPISGHGALNIDLDRILTPGPLRLFSANRSLDSIQGVLKGPLGKNSQLEQWGFYYPQAIGGYPYTVFYKILSEQLVHSQSIGKLIAANSTLGQYMVRHGASTKKIKKKSLQNG